MPLQEPPGLPRWPASRGDLLPTGYCCSQYYDHKHYHNHKHYYKHKHNYNYKINYNYDYSIR